MADDKAPQGEPDQDQKATPKQEPTIKVERPNPSVQSTFERVPPRILMAGTNPTPPPPPPPPRPNPSEESQRGRDSSDVERRR